MYEQSDFGNPSSPQYPVAALRASLGIDDAPLEDAARRSASGICVVPEFPVPARPMRKMTRVLRNLLLAVGDPILKVMDALGNPCEWQISSPIGGGRPRPGSLRPDGQSPSWTRCHQSRVENGPNHYSRRTG